MVVCKLTLIVQIWMPYTFPLEQQLIDLHQQPLMTVLQFLRDPRHHNTFRNLAENVFVGVKPLDFARSELRLASSYVKCPVLDCPSRFKSNAKLVAHMHEHSDLRRLSVKEWDDLMGMLPESDVKPSVLGGAPAPAASATLPLGAGSARPALKRPRDE